MPANAVTVPFTIPSLYGGLAEGSGLATASQAGLVLELEVADAMVGVFKSQAKDFAIPYRELASVTLRKGWWRTGLVVRAKRLKTLGELPGSEQGELHLRVARKDRPLAEELVALLNHFLAEHDLNQLRDELNQ